MGLQFYESDALKEFISRNSLQQIYNPMREKHDTMVQIDVFGAHMVGKNTLLRVFTEPEEPATLMRKPYLPTIGSDLCTTVVRIGGAWVKTNIWDFSGQDRFRSMCKSYFRGMQGSVYVFDVYDKSSLEYVRNFHTDALQHIHMADAPLFILVGNHKVPASRDSKRQVSIADAVEFAQQQGWPYFEVHPTLEREHVNSAHWPFCFLIEQCVLQKRLSTRLWIGV